jgi:hypothetical protein
MWYSKVDDDDSDFPTWACFAIIGCFSICLTFVWWKYIPFTAQLLVGVAHVTAEHRGMIVVSFVGAMLCVVWGFVSFLAVGASMAPDPETQTSDVTYVPLIGLIWFWGTLVFKRVGYVTFCGVYGRWYFGGQGVGQEEITGNFRRTGSLVGGNPAANADPLLGQGDTVSPSLQVSLTTSFGTICFGSLIVALVQLVQAIAQAAQNKGSKDGNVVVMLVGCCLDCCLNCIGDILEYLNDWSYVQCAIRGSSYTDSARITFSLCKCSNIPLIMGDLIIGSVVGMAALISGLAGGSVTYLTNTAPEKNAGTSFVIGCFISLFVANASLCMIDAGTKTILSCWAEDPQPLQKHHKEMHEALESHLRR